jgi:hypothetical protein
MECITTTSEPQAGTIARQPPAPWTRTTARRPCPLCRRAGCLSAGTAVICRHVESAEQINGRGWLHEITRGPTWAPWRLSLTDLPRRAADE